MRNGPHRLRRHMANFTMQKHSRIWYNIGEQVSSSVSGRRLAATIADGDMIQRKHFLVKGVRCPIPGFPGGDPEGAARYSAENV